MIVYYELLKKGIKNEFKSESSKNCGGTVFT